MKRIVILICACLLCALPASAAVYTGTVAATEQVNVVAPFEGTIAGVTVAVGGVVSTGDAVARYETRKVYATGDGTVAAVWAAEGEQINGTLVEVEPIAKCTVYATTDGADVLVHAGEDVYIKCTADGTHRGTGVVTSVDGETYMVMTTGGAFYVGETVYLYRDADFTSAGEIGIGTLIYTDNALYEATGTVAKLYVAAGERVERGQLLCELLGGESADVNATASGIVASVLPTQDEGATGDALAESAETTAGGDSEVSADDSKVSASDIEISTGGNETSTGDSELSAGDNAVSAGDVLAVVYPYEGILVEISVPEAQIGEIAVGQTVEVAFADDPDAICAGVVERVGNIGANGSYAVFLSVDRAKLPVGLTCEVIIQ